MYTCIGKIINTHGIKGAVKVYPYTDDIHRFEQLDMVYVGEEKELLHARHAGYLKSMVLLEFEEFDNINQVLYLKDQMLFIKDEDRLTLEDGRHYISDLIGLAVKDESGTVLGKLIEVYEGTANDVYYVETSRGVGGIPAVREFILEINIKEKFMVIRPIEGMLP